MKTILDIGEFGSIDAENDSQLIENFYKTEIITELLEGRKSIVIGRKGTGKTAIYKYICDEYESEAVPLLFKDYPWKLHDKFVNSIVSERESFVNSWTFLFNMEILKKIISNEKNLWDREERKIIKKMKRWMRKNWGSIGFDYRETLCPKGSKYSFSFSPQIMGNGLGSIAKEIATESELGQTLAEYNKKLEKIIDKLLRNYRSKIILAFDQLDLAYSYEDSNYSNKLIGLLLTTYAYYRKYENVRVIVFLRSDIFANINFQDKNKIKDNLTEFLNWEGTQELSKLSLKKMIAIRIKNSLSTGTHDFENNWNVVFEQGKISKNQFKWNFILDRTFLRPRDIIKFLNLALDQAKLRLKENPQGIKLITNEDIHHMRADYSTYLFEELKDEISGKYPNFTAYLEILRGIHTVTFQREEFEENYSKLKGKYKIEEDFEIIMQRLYEFSIIGFYKPGGGGYGGSSYMYQYTSDYQSFNPIAQKYQVHWGFKEYLDLIENR